MYAKSVVLIGFALNWISIPLFSIVAAFKKREEFPVEVEEH
jgi:hypothetical protein